MVTLNIIAVEDYNSRAVEHYTIRSVEHLTTHLQSTASPSTQGARMVTLD